MKVGKTEKYKVRSFYNGLKEDISKDGGIYRDYLKYCPSFFKLLCNLLKDNRTDWHTRLIINAALAYFVVPNDIIPEKRKGVIGYIDDVFLCAYVLYDIKKKVSKKLIVDNWEEEGNILQIIEDVFWGTRRIILKQYSDILKFVGLKTEDKLSHDIKSSRVYKMYEEAIYKNVELFGILSYLVKKLYNIPEQKAPKNLEEIKEFLELSGEMHKIRDIIGFLERKFLREEE